MRTHFKLSELLRERPGLQRLLLSTVVCAAVAEPHTNRAQQRKRTVTGCRSSIEMRPRGSPLSVGMAPDGGNVRGASETARGLKQRLRPVKEAAVCHGRSSPISERTVGCWYRSYPTSCGCSARGRQKLACHWRGNRVISVNPLEDSLANCR